MPRLRPDGPVGFGGRDALVPGIEAALHLGHRVGSCQAGLRPDARVGFGSRNARVPGIEAALRLGHRVWGSSWSQTERLWGARDVSEIDQGARFEATQGLDVELGYGLGGPGAQGVVTPYTGLSLSEGAGRTLRAGARWNLAPGAVLGLEATQQSGAYGTPGTRALEFRTELRW